MENFDFCCLLIWGGIFHLYMTDKVLQGSCISGFFLFYMIYNISGQWSALLKNPQGGGVQVGGVHGLRSNKGWLLGRHHLEDLHKTQNTPILKQLGILLV